ncbi:hypothetical protein A5893_02450 [Pedobacter psychrophilus]|uniref:Uncharacterized protein n=1 Tax=Pedobacter psychrophilus TaxID=1826909 RepID=A0A179DMP7_9SPHI|nr:hypothetical protein [Pedobacter psychrophilus]OAQ42000.1 hypothetical protein A5893_02450 [Pedobacter psychrophilus]
MKRNSLLLLIFSILIITSCAVKKEEKLNANNLFTGGELIFQTGFEGTSKLVPRTRNKPGSDSHSYDTDDIIGVDNTLAGHNDWVKDFDENPKAGEFMIEYTGGDSTKRYVKIIPEPNNPKNHVLQFWLNDWWLATENQKKARIQADVYGIKSGFREFHQSVRVFLNDDFKALEKYPDPITWLTISEFWNNEWWVATEKYGFRVTLGIGKPTAAESKLHFILNAEDAGQKEVWNDNNHSKVAVPIGKWFIMDYYFKEGDDKTGRFYMTITPDGEKKQVIFDVTGFTHNTYDPAPNGVTGYSPLKLYTSKELVQFIKDQNKTLQIYWDDFKLWRIK